MSTATTYPPKYNQNNDMVCDWCGYAITYKRDVLQDWISPKGTFCSESHALAGQNNCTWREPGYTPKN